MTHKRLILNKYLAGNISFNFIASEEFHRYVKFLRLGTYFPNCHRLKTQLKKFYDSFHDKLLPPLGANTCVFIALDYWGSQN